MEKKTMELLFKKHSTWIDIVASFGCDRYIAEDIVQECYIKIQLKLKKGLDIKYNDDINYYYIFKTLRTLFIDFKRKGKNIHMVSLENIESLEADVDYEDKYKTVQKELNKMYWYDKRVFLLVNDGESIASLSRKTKIPYYSLYNTYKKVKDRLLKKII